MEMNLKPCPFCGTIPYLEKVPLWNGSHGYHGCYKYDVHCRNPECGCQVNLGGNNTVYNTDEEARHNAIEAWNRRAFGPEYSDEEWDKFVREVMSDHEEPIGPLSYRLGYQEGIRFFIGCLYPAFITSIDVHEWSELLGKFTPWKSADEWSEFINEEIQYGEYISGSNSGQK